MTYRLHSRITLISLLATLLVAAQGSGGEIHELLIKGEVEKAKALLIKDPKLKDTRDDLQRTPLHYAVDLKQIEIAKLLLEQGADVNARAYNDFTPLHFAEDPEMVRLLIAHKADIGGRALQDALWNYRHYAGEPKSTEAEKWRTITKILLDAGAYYDIYSAVFLDDLSRVKTLLKEDPKRALDKWLMRDAVSDGRTEIVKLLLDNKADPKDSGDGGLPVLWFALKHPDVVRVLIQAGADPNVRWDYYGTVNGVWPYGDLLLHRAAEGGQVETARLLIEAGAEVDCKNDRNKATPLDYAAYCNQPEMVRLLLEKKASVKGEAGRKAMSWAGAYPHRPRHEEEQFARYKTIIALLREAGVPVDILTAVRLGDIDLVRKLLKEKPALLSTKDVGKRTLLSLAVSSNHKEIVAEILDAGASIDGSDESGSTALHWAAAIGGREEIAKLLISRHADVNARTKQRVTPLHEASQWGNAAVAKLLLAAGADVNARDDEGKTPLAWAEESNQEIIELLKKHGGK